MSERVQADQDKGMFSIDYLRDRIAARLRDVPERTPDVVADCLEQHIADSMPDLDATELIASIRDTEEGDIVLAAAHLLQRFLKNHFTLEELEMFDAQSRSDRKEAEQVPGFILNEAVHVTPSKEGPGVVYLHIMAVASRPPREQKTLIEDGMRILVGRLGGDTALNQVHTVKAASWLVVKHQRRMTDYGFTVEDPEEKPWLAVATVEELKKRWL